MPEPHHSIKAKFIKKPARGLKAAYYIAVEAIGWLFLWTCRLLRIIPPVLKYSKSRVRKILIIRTDRIGDVILSTPVVKALRDYFPDSFIAFLTTPYTEELVSENKDINDVILYSRNASFAKKIRFFRMLKRYRFDLAVVLCPYFRAALLAYVSGAPVRIGYPANGSGFLYTIKVDQRNRYKHETEASLDVVRTIGIDTDDKRPQLQLSARASKYADDLCSKEGISSSDLIIGIHPGGHQRHTRWPADRYAETANVLISHYEAKVILLGGSGDKRIIDEILSCMPTRPIVPDLGNSLQNLAAIIKRCNIFLGNNSGPMHVASAVGTPVVAIFGPVHPLEHENKWLPLGEEHMVVRKKMDCTDCHPGHCKGMECISAVTVEDVIEALDIQISRTTGKL